MADKQTFLNQIKQGALDTWKKYGVLPSLVASQAILESGWGGSELATKGNNLFGIKADSSWKGTIIELPTKEFVNNKWINTIAKWRVYNSQDESVIDHGEYFINNKRYAKVLNEKDYKNVCKLVYEAGYATNPEYPSKLIQIIEQNNLSQWDKEVLDVKSEPVKTPVKNDKLYRLVTGTFVSKESAEKAKLLIEQEFGYTMYLKEE